MRKFLKLNLLFLLTTSILGCDKIAEKGDENANAKFYDIVYQVESTRENKNYAWTPVQGLMQMKISQSSTTEGTFVFYYSNYKEPQFVFNLCTGGFKGNVSIVENTGTTDTSGGIYDPSLPYNTGTATSTSVDLTDPDDPSKTISPIVQYSFDLNINFRDLEPSCRAESNRKIILYRFANGQVVMINEYRELKMNPVLVELQ